MTVVNQDTQSVRLHLLGPFELVVDGAVVDVPRSRVRDLLTILATQTPDIISHDALIDALWAEEVPKNPRAALRVVLSRARKSLGERADALASTPLGFRLYASTDVEEFLDPDPDTDDADVLVRALALWRGEPHASLLPTITMSSHAHRLTERRINLLVRLAELLITDGRPTAASELVEAEATTRPTAEPLAIRLAEAYAADGRKADALRALERTRQALRDELGIGPSPEFDTIERRILSDTVTITPQTSPIMAHTDGPLVGRSHELERLLDSTEVHLALIGEAGIGKTRLLDEACHRWEAEGGVVIRTRCSQAPQRAMEVLADVLAQTIDRVPGEISGEDALAIRRVDRTLVSDPGELVAAPIQRVGMVSVLAAFLDDRLGGIDATLVLDDVHWIDHRSAEVVAELVAQSRVRIVIATRPTNSETRLSFSEHEQIALASLGEAHTGQLISHTLGQADRPDLVALIHEQSGGNPLFVGLLTSLVAEGALRPSQPLPMTALVAVQSRIDRLSGPSRQTLLTASVLGQRVDLPLLTALRPSAMRDIGEAEEEGLIRIDEDQERCHFVHALVAQGAYELLSEGHRSDLHDQVAVALVGRSDAAIEFARHAAKAEAHDPYRCVEAHIGAARAYLHTLAFEAAAAQVRAAHRVMQRWELRDDGLMAELRLVEGEALRWDDGPSSSAAFLKAAGLARSLGDTALMTEAALGLCRRGQNTLAGVVDVAATDAVERCLRRDDLTSDQRARLLAGSAVLFAVSTADIETRTRFQEAITIARNRGDEQLEAEILLETDFGLSHPADFAKRVAAVERLRELAGDDPDLRWEAAWLEFGVSVVVADVDRASAACVEMREGLAHCIQRPRDFGMAIVESVVCQAGGNYEDAQGWADHALNTGLALYPESWAMNAYGALLLGIRRAEGRVGELSETFEAMLESNPGFPTWEVCAAYAAIERGELDRATQLFDVLAADRFDRLVMDGSWTSAVGVLAEIASALDRPDDASILSDLLEPFSGTMLWSGLSPFGAADASLAQAATACSRPAEAVTYSAKASTIEARLQPLERISRVPPKSS